MKRRSVRPRLPETKGENDGWEQQKRQNNETNPLELSNKSIEIVERNQLNRRTKSMDLFHENDFFA
jgi:hypothetical protein